MYPENYKRFGFYFQILEHKMYSVINENTPSLLFYHYSILFKLLGAN